MGISTLPAWVYWTAMVLSVGAAILAVVDQNTFRLVLSLFQIVFFTIFAVISQRHSRKR